MGNQPSAQENDERKRHMARGKKPMPDHRTKPLNPTSTERREKSEVAGEEVEVSCSKSAPEAAGDGGNVRVQMLASCIRSDLKIDCPTIVTDLGRQKCRLSRLSKVPHRMVGANPQAYTPSVVSIGPYHWASSFLKGMEVEKRQFLELNLWSKEEKTWNGYVQVMAKLEADARKYYPDLITAMDSNAFLSMMLLDGFYILGLLYPLSFVRVQSNDAHDAVDIWHDLLLLENQIPFIIVERICEQWAWDAGEDSEIVLAMVKEQATSSIESVLCNLSIPFAIDPSQRPENFEHLLFLLHAYFKPSSLHTAAIAHGPGDQTPTNRPPNLMNMNRYSVGRVAGRILYKISIVLLNWAYNFYNRNQHHHIERNNNTSQEMVHCHLHLHRAVQYQEAGIKFRTKESSGHKRHSLLDITISKDVLEIPRIRVDESTYWLFGNLIAFEQTNPSIEKDVTAYVIFMSQLMATPEDVNLLSREGIVQQQLGSNRDVSNLFASLARDVMFDFDSDYHLSPVCEALEERRKKPKKLRAMFVRRHCANPWLWLGAFVVFFLFVCTTIMTVFTIMAYVRLPHHDDKKGLLAQPPN
ncbi:hypothetical protein LUZ62_022093 [Rhynchospora pubera]|uniref:Uncharacterized protein n=1 Tax=Rhynchospora pubera TaxID=906938 RepID=A0AAV8GWB6_9POAL|nr:hypothetical protein LUZ62_022093 [Rhynchospora pubera]